VLGMTASVSSDIWLLSLVGNARLGVCIFMNGFSRALVQTRVYMYISQPAGGGKSADGGDSCAMLILQ
jgi:hypothetical protein